MRVKTYWDRLLALTCKQVRAVCQQDVVSLVRQYEPVLLFSKDGDQVDENFFPASAEHFVPHCRLYRKGAVPITPHSGLTPAYLGKMSPTESKECYLAYVADHVLDASTKLLQNGGVALLTLDQTTEAFWLTEPVRAAETMDLVPALHPVEPSAGVAFEAAAPDALAPEGQALYAITGIQHLSEKIRDKALARYAPYRDFVTYPPVYYYRVMRSRGFVVIQYWFFYVYNDWGTSHGGANDHEGDWESIYVFLQGDAPAYVAYSAHTGSPEWHAWNDSDVEKRLGTHPVVYVGCGSHASYFTKGKRGKIVKDYANGDSDVTIGPGAAAPWGRPVNLDNAAWVHNFAGGWGALVKKWGSGKAAKLLGMWGPTGPAWHWEQWETPVAWAKIPH